MEQSFKKIKVSGLRGGVAVVGLLAMVAVGLARGQTLAETDESFFDDLSVEVGADVFSKYVWRGMLLTDDPVVQPSLTLGLAGFSFNVWGSVDLTDVNEGTPDDPFSQDGPRYRLQELDYTLSYAFEPAEGLSLELGYILYTFPGTEYSSTQEVYASVGVAVPYLDPTLTVYWDFDEAESLYATLAVGHTFALTEALGLSLGGSIAYGDKNYHEFYLGADSARLSDYSLSASLDYALNDNASVSFSVAYADFIDRGIRSAADDGYGHSDNFFVGIGFSYSF